MTLPAAPEVSDPIMERVARLREEQKRIRDEVAFLLRLRSRPTVTPVIVAWVHGGLERHEVLVFTDPEEDRTALGQASDAADRMIEANAGAPVGVEVGGCLIDMADLEDMRAACIS